MKSAYIALGSNRGDRESYMRQALLRMEGRGLRLVRVSSLYETRAVGEVPQPDFLNAVAQAVTGLGAHAVLRILLSVEAELGRHRYQPRGPRTVDLDLLLCGDEEHRDIHLVLPHPRLEERSFVLLPLAEVAPELKLPGGRTAPELASTMDNSGVKAYTSALWPGALHYASSSAPFSTRSLR